MTRERIKLDLVQLLMGPLVKKGSKEYYTPEINDISKEIARLERLPDLTDDGYDRLGQLRLRKANLLASRRDYRLQK